MTDPKTIDPSLLHPWLRKCLRNPNLEKKITKDKGDIDVYTVSTMALEYVLDLVRGAQYSTMQQCNIMIRHHFPMYIKAIPICVCLDCAVHYLAFTGQPNRCTCIIMVQLCTFACLRCECKRKMLQR